MKNIIKIILVINVLLGISTFLLPIEGRSLLEGRTLSNFIKPKLNSVLSGNYFTTFEEAFDDQITGRNKFLSINSKLQDIVKVKYRNDIFLGKNDFLFRLSAYHPTSEEYIEKEITIKYDILDELYNQTENESLFLYIHIPSKINIYNDELPKSYLTNEVNDERRKIRMREKIEESNKDIIYVDGEALLLDKKDDYIYFKTDHHYTGLGAYYVYKGILDAVDQHSDWDLNIPEYSDFQHERLAGEFVGSEARLISDLNYSKVDYVDAALPSNMPEFKRWNNDEASSIPLVDFESPNTYSTFMGGDWPNTIIKTENKENPTILILGDSFTNALEPLAVYNAYEMHSLDPRHYEGDIFKYIKDLKPDITIIVRDSLLADELFKGDN